MNGRRGARWNRNDRADPVRISARTAAVRGGVAVGLSDRHRRQPPQPRHLVGADPGRDDDRVALLRRGRARHDQPAGRQYLRSPISPVANIAGPLIVAETGRRAAGRNLRPSRVFRSASRFPRWICWESTGCSPLSWIAGKRHAGQTRKFAQGGPDGPPYPDVCGVGEAGGGNRPHPGLIVECQPCGPGTRDEPFARFRRRVNSDPIILDPGRTE